MSFSARSLLALFRKEPSRSRLDELCEFPPLKGEQEALVFWFTELMAWLRPQRGQNVSAKLRFLERHLEQQPEWKKNLTEMLGMLVKQTEVDRLLAYGGIPTEFHFGGAVRDWFLAWTLPPACRTHDGGQIVGLAFEQQDLSWIGREDVIAFFRALLDEEAIDVLEKGLEEALIELGHQIVAQAHAPNVRTLAQSERSPFRGLYEAVQALNAHPHDHSVLPSVLGRIKQCDLLLASHRLELLERGANLNTTFQLTRLRQQLDRLALLAKLRTGASNTSLGVAARDIVQSVIKSASGTRLFRRSSDVLVQNLVDTAATVGRAYLEEEHSSWRAAFMAGAGGGALMAIATLVKFFLGSLHLTTFYEGFAFSLNYAAVFCAAYLLHFTIATKLPAHTAAALARSVQGEGGHGQRLRAFGGVWRTILRLQIAGLVGNVVVVGPLAFLFDVIANKVLGHHLISHETAEHVFHANSLLGPSALYAALTGLFLWISSLIGASGDNWTRVIGLTDRIATNRTVMKRVNPIVARNLADGVVQRAGGLLGNLSLGFMLGGIPAAFAIASLPVEIRHVTVSTGSLALAIAQGEGSRSDILFASLGVLVIGVVNVTVSFILALWLALRATHGMRTSVYSNALVWIGLRKWSRGRLGKERNNVPPTRVSVVPQSLKPESLATAAPGSVPPGALQSVPPGALPVKSSAAAVEPSAT